MGKNGRNKEERRRKFLPPKGLEEFGLNPALFLPWPNGQFVGLTLP